MAPGLVSEGGSHLGEGVFLAEEVHTEAGTHRQPRTREWLQGRVRVGLHKWMVKYGREVIAKGPRLRRSASDALAESH